MYDDDFDDDFANTPVTRIPQNKSKNQQLGNAVLKQAEQYLAAISEDEHGFLIQSLLDLAKDEPYFEVLAEQLDQPMGNKIANDALNFLYFWQIISQYENPKDFKILDIINSEDFQTELLKAFDLLEIGETKAQRRQVLLESLKLYKLDCHAGCIPLLYAQLEGVLTDVLIQKGYLKQNGTKFVDVYKIVPGLKGNEIKSLWHKSKIAVEISHYFAELNAYKMDSSSTVSSTRHNILHGTDVSHFHQGRSFVLFIWLFASINFISTLKA